MAKLIKALVGSAAGTLAGAAVLGAAIKIGDKFRKPDKLLEKEVRSEARKTARELLKKGQGKWITVRGRKIFIPKNKKKYGTLNSDLNFRDKP